jgi:hypothetical protein
MQEVRLYDPGRKPPHWTALIREGQFAVCHFDYKTGTWRTARGTYSALPEEETILIFESLDEAQSYGRNFVLIQPTLFCRLYDSRGTAEGLVETIYPPSIADKIQGPASGRRHIGRGLLQLTVSALCVYVDWRITGIVILGAVVGSKFLYSGLNSIVQGVDAIVKSRNQKSGLAS